MARRVTNATTTQGAQVVAVSPPSPFPKVERFHFIKHATDANRKLIEGADFRSGRFTDANGKGMTFVKCDFSYSIFERTYFRDAVFQQCKFSGARFIDSNLRQAHFSRCDLGYVEFCSTLLEVRDVVASLPIQPNMRSDVLRSLKVNAASTDDYEGRSFLVLEQIRNTEDHLTRAVSGADSYYQDKYKTLWSRLKAGARLAVHKASGAIWGHGERPLRLIWSIIWLLAALAAFDAIAVLQPGNVRWQDALWVSSKHVVDLFLGLPSNRPAGAVEAIDYVICVARPVYLGLLVSILYKYIGRR